MTTFQQIKNSLRADMAQWAPDVLRQAAARLESSALRNVVASDREHTATVLSVLQGRAQAFSLGWIGALQALAEEAAPAPSPASNPLVLSMLAEDQIDEDIEVARIVQGIEHEAEGELRELAALCSRLQGRDDIAAEANPLHPVLLARALRHSLDAFNLQKGARLLLLRQIGPVLGQRLKQVYAQHCDRLVQQGVTPARYRVRQDAGPARRPPGAAPAGTGATPAAPATPAADAPAGLPPTQAGTLARLVQWALDSSPRPGPQEPGGATAPPLRLLAELLPAGSLPAPALSAAAAVLVMERLLAVLERQVTISDSMRGLMRRLDGPARELAASDPGLWRSLDHPWWQLLDRMISAGSVQDEIETHQPGAPGAPGAVKASLARVVGQLEAATPPNAELLRGALVDVDAVVSGLMEERCLRIEPEATTLQADADAEEAEILLRQQMVEQLRLAPAPAALRQFLLGPWVIAMAQAAVTRGESSVEFDGLAATVDALVEACTRAPGQALPPHRLEHLLKCARDGLAHAALDPHRVERELKDLRRVLLHPTQAGEPCAEEYTDALPTAHVIGGHAGLPTVPIDMVDTAKPTRASLDRQAWIESLEPGDYCRIFLQTRWMTAQLTWRSRNRKMFVFTSRHAGRAHSMTRRALEKLRNAGLVTTIEHGELIALAMDTLIEDDDAR